MGKAIEKYKNITIGHAGLGFWGNAIGSVRQQVHDGDTITVRTIGNFGIRFLAVDAPEISAQLPGSNNFTGLNNSKWEDFLKDPFSQQITPFTPVLDPGLLGYLHGKVGPGAAINHYNHAVASEDALEDLVQDDIEKLGETKDTFQFFLVFAYEILDRYARLLCYINRNQPDENNPEPRPKTYNERLLEMGKVSPYFIFPNINPFKKATSIVDAVIDPNSARDVADTDSALSQARQWVKTNRQQKRGIFQQNDPLRLEAFELRFLSRRIPPNRWVIDLGKNNDVLIKPQNYYTITNIEDRLFIPEEYVDLFIEHGWRKQ